MTQENQSYLRFSLEESVWFQKGQEVEELYSISLDPNITLTEDDHYVYIRGTLDLSGEYKNDEENEENEDYANIFFPKSIQNVERHPNGIYEFVHRFPVDITIPSSRIASLDDIEVSIQTFDYTIPERNSLKLQADLIISGIYSESFEEPSSKEDDLDMTIDDELRVEDAEEEVVELEISEVLSNLDDLVEKDEELADEIDIEDSIICNQRNEEQDAEKVEKGVEDKEDNKKTKVFDVHVEAPVKNATGVPPIPDFQPAFRESEEDKGELFEPFIVEAKRIPEIEEQEERQPVYLSEKQDIPQLDIPVQNATEDQPIERKDDSMLVMEEKEQDVEPVMVENKEKITKQREDVSLLQLVQKSRRPSPPVDNHEQKQDIKQVDKLETQEKLSESISIADFFSRKQEEEHVRVKVCIVQKGETLDDLAERYSISVQTLIQSNELQPNQDIYEGQVLYIRQSHTYKN